MLDARDDWFPRAKARPGLPDWKVKPAIVFDPFVGSGTTNLVARRLGRDSVGLDLSLTYLRDVARPRLGLDMLDAWEHGVKAKSSDLSDLPMFEVIGGAE